MFSALSADLAYQPQDPVYIDNYILMTVLLIVYH